MFRRVHHPRETHKRIVEKIMQYSFYIKYNATRAFKVSWKLLYDGWWEKSIYNELIVKTYKWELSIDLVWYIWLQAGVNQAKKSVACLSKILLNHQSFLYYQHSWRESRSSFPYKFYLEVPFIGPVKANTALYHIDSNFL